MRRVKEAPRTAIQSNTLLVRTLFTQNIMKITQRRAYGPKEFANKETSVRSKAVDCLTPITSAVRPAIKEAARSEPISTAVEASYSI